MERRERPERGRENCIECYLYVFQLIQSDRNASLLPLYCWSDKGCVSSRCTQLSHGPLGTNEKCLRTTCSGHPLSRAHLIKTVPCCRPGSRHIISMSSRAESVHQLLICKQSSGHLPTGWVRTVAVVCGVGTNLLSHQPH